MARNKAKKGSPFLSLLIVMLALLIALSVAGTFYLRSLDVAVDPNNKETQVVEIPDGSSTTTIGEILEEKGLISSALSFRIFSKYKTYDGRYQSGLYTLSPSMTMEEIGDILIEGKTNTFSFTIPEGYTEYDMAEKLADEGIVDQVSFVELLETGDFTEEFPFLKDAQKGKHRLEGYLFPSTYTIATGSEDKTIIMAMLNQYSEIFTDEMRAKAKEMGRTENEIIVIASMIESESQVDEDRGKVASVIYNRIKKGMHLEIDATVKYAFQLQGEKKTSLTFDDLKIKSEYNTYLIDGIPPGPICSPGEASIKAALDPEDTDYLYYVLDEKLDGTHVFSKDYNDFLKNREKYYNAMEKES